MNDPANPTTGLTNGWPQLSTYKPDVDKAAAGLAIATVGGTNYLYAVTDGYIGDGGNYQGHVTIINLSTNTQVVFNTLCSNEGNKHFDSGGGSVPTQNQDCSNHQSGIWGRPGTVFDARQGKIFFTTGNFGASIDGSNWGESVLALPANLSAAMTAPGRLVHAERMGEHGRRRSGFFVAGAAAAGADEHGAPAHGGDGRQGFAGAPARCRSPE